MSKRWLWLVLVQVVLGMGWGAPGNAAGQAVRYEVPLRFYGTRPAVEVRVNGQGPFLFLVDTGAGGAPARADASLVKRLSIARLGSTETADAGGATTSIDEVMLDRLEVAGLTFNRVAALSRDYGSQSYLTKIDGILGIEFFRGWLLTIDYVRGTLRMDKGALPRADGVTVLDYELIEGNAYIRATLGKRPVKVMLDTGNIRGLDVPSSWLKGLRMNSFPRVAGNSSGVSGTTAIREVRLSDPLVIGKHRIPRPEVTFSDDFAEANFGSSLLQDFVVTLDQRNHRVRLVRPAER